MHNACYAQVSRIEKAMGSAAEVQQIDRLDCGISIEFICYGRKPMQLRTKAKPDYVRSFCDSI